MFIKVSQSIGFASSNSLQTAFKNTISIVIQMLSRLYKYKQNKVTECGAPLQGGVVSYPRSRPCISLSTDSSLKTIAFPCTTFNIIPLLVTVGFTTQTSHKKIGKMQCKCGKNAIIFLSYKFFCPEKT